MIVCVLLDSGSWWKFCQSAICRTGFLFISERLVLLAGICDILTGDFGTLSRVSEHFNEIWTVALKAVQGPKQEVVLSHRMFLPTWRSSPELCAAHGASQPGWIQDVLNVPLSESWNVVLQIFAILPLVKWLSKAAKAQFLYCWGHQECLWVCHVPESCLSWVFVPG